MIGGDFVTESREVRGFDRVHLAGYGELVVRQGDKECLTVDTHPNLLPKIVTEVVDGQLRLGQGGTLLDKLGFAMETSLTRKPIRYDLTVRKLTELEVGGAVLVRSSGISTDRLTLKSKGPNRLIIEELRAGFLTVDMPVGGVVEVTGSALEQHASVRGPGDYRAAGLETARASVVVSGPGSAEVWATEELDVVVRGIGSVRYHGAPRIKRRISGMGTLVCLA